MLVGWARDKLEGDRALDVADLWLMVRSPSIRTLGDLREADRDARADVDQAVVLGKMAEVKLGNAHALDSSLITTNHPDGMQALLTGRIDRALDLAVRVARAGAASATLAKSYGYFGAHSFLVTVVTQFYDDNTAFSNRFYRLVKQSIDLINKRPGVAQQSSPARIRPPRPLLSSGAGSRERVLGLYGGRVG